MSVLTLQNLDQNKLAASIATAVVTALSAALQKPEPTAAPTPASNRTVTRSVKQLRFPALIASVMDKKHPTAVTLELDRLETGPGRKIKGKLVQGEYFFFRSTAGELEITGRELRKLIEQNEKAFGMLNGHRVIVARPAE